MRARERVVGSLCPAEEHRIGQHATLRLSHTRKVELSLQTVTCMSVTRVGALCCCDGCTGPARCAQPSGSPLRETTNLATLEITVSNLGLAAGPSVSNFRPCADPRTRSPNFGRALGPDVKFWPNSGLHGQILAKPLGRPLGCVKFSNCVKIPAPGGPPRVAIFFRSRTAHACCRRG